MNFIRTPSIMAPEIFRHVEQDTTSPGYSLSVDIWSIGVLAFVLLSGDMPFDEGHFQDLIAAKYSFSRPTWQTISDEAKDWIRHLLVADPAKRYDIQDRK